MSRETVMAASSATLAAAAFRLSIDIKVVELNALARAQARPCTCDTPQETLVMLQLVIEPIVFRRETDQDSRRLAVPGDDDLFARCQTKRPGKIVFDLSYSYLS